MEVLNVNYPADWSLDQKDAFSRGFDNGNYACAYETEDFEAHFERLTPHAREYRNKAPEAFAAGALLGFFSSFELNEIPEEYRERVAELRSAHDCED
jgi:hypothetical protein